MLFYKYKTAPFTVCKFTIDFKGLIASHCYKKYYGDFNHYVPMHIRFYYIFVFEEMHIAIFPFQLDINFFANSEKLVFPVTKSVLQ